MRHEGPPGSGPRAASVSAINRPTINRSIGASGARACAPTGSRPRQAAPGSANGRQHVHDRALRFLASISCAAPAHERASDAMRSDPGGGPPDLRFESDVVPGVLSGAERSRPITFASINVSSRRRRLIAPRRPHRAAAVCTPPVQPAEPRAARADSCAALRASSAEPDERGRRSLC